MFFRVRSHCARFRYRFSMTTYLKCDTSVVFVVRTDGNLRVWVLTGLSRIISLAPVVKRVVPRTNILAFFFFYIPKDTAENRTRRSRPVDVSSPETSHSSDSLSHTNLLSSLFTSCTLLLPVIIFVIRTIKVCSRRTSR